MKRIVAIGLSVLGCSFSMNGVASADVLVQVDQSLAGSYLSTTGDAGVSATLSDLANINAATDINDNLWTPRADWITVVSLDAMHSRGSSDDSPEMTITVTGLTAGAEYDLYVRYFVFTGAGGVAYQSRFGLTSGSLTTYDANTAGATTLASRPSDGRFMLWESLHATVAASAGGELVVYFDDTGTSEGVINGIRLAAVPEPAAIGLFGAAIGLCALRRRVVR